MIIIVDSGSTKADWFVYKSANDQRRLHTQGFNPFFYKSEEITSILLKEFEGNLDTDAVEAVYYYGAGCSDDLRCNMMKAGLSPVFPNAHIEVEHDLTGSARATCGHGAGIACIVGTGSNSCYYDGSNIVDHITNLGFLLGDEGSGSHLGKELLRCYFYREMPRELEEKFVEKFQLKERAFLNKLYSHHTPNTYLASFAVFLSEHKNHTLIREIVKKSLGQFLDRHPCKYPGHQKLPIHFVGSIAFHFQNILLEVMQERNLIMGNLVQKPIENLLLYHLNKVKSISNDD